MHPSSESMFVNHSSDLYQRTMARVLHKHRRMIRRRFLWVNLGLSLSLAALCVFGLQLWHEMSVSGFRALLTMLMEDRSVLTAYGREMGMALLETIPAVSLAFVCLGVAGFLFFMRSLGKVIRTWSETHLQFSSSL